MPIYDFKCRECGKISEVLVRGTENQGIKCHGCGGGKMERLLSTPALVKVRNSSSGETCCGRAERCESPPCSAGESCRRH